MSSTEELLALARGALDAAKKGEAVEAYAAWGRETEVKVYEGEVESLTSAESSGVGVRVISDGRLGYAYAADPSREELAGLVEKARTNAALAAPDEGNVLPEPRPIPPLEGILLPDLLSASAEDKVKLALAVERACRSADKRVSGVETAQYGEGIGRAAIASTSGVEAAGERGDCWAVAVALAGGNGETQTGFGLQIARRPGDLDVDAAGREAAERSVVMLGAKKPKTGRMPVLLDPFSAASFLGVVAAGLTAESVIKGRSLFADKLGERVASDVVRLVDDGRALEGPGAEPFDGEGVPTGRTQLIASGVLNAFLHNTYTATRMGATSTGNARRGGFKSTPGVAPTNLILEPGTESAEELYARAGNALLVHDLIGVHSGANPISGDFSVGATGVMIENGSLGAPVREATIASNVLDILRGIVAVGSDIRYLPFGGAIGTPTILIGEMTVAGT
ncbi:MAG: TldD/PmbA family protein [Actinomycetota bacterium]